MELFGELYHNEYSGWQNISPKQPGVDVEVEDDVDVEDEVSIVPVFVSDWCSRIKRVEVLLLAFIFDDKKTNGFFTFELGEQLAWRDADKVCAVTISRAFILRRPSSSILRA